MSGWPIGMASLKTHEGKMCRKRRKAGGEIELTKQSQSSPCIGLHFVKQ